MTGTFHKAASPAAISTEVMSLRWLSEAESVRGAAVATLLSYQPMVPGPPLNGPLNRDVIQPP